MADLPLSLALGFGIGISLGLLGGGGSILTVPALVYLIGQTPQAAVTTSLAIVGANSVVGAYFHSANGSLNWRVALMFGGAGMGVAYLAAGLSHLFTPAALLVMFALLMVSISIIMLLQHKKVERGTHQAGWPVIIGAGASVGLLTGILGVGGGFLIVPALVMLVGLPMYQAVGTSLVIIAANSLAGFIGHLEASLFDTTLTVIFVATGLAGTYAGSRLAQRVPAQRLKQVFAVFVLVLALYLLADNLPKL
jgi:uncharacterized protein